MQMTTSGYISAFQGLRALWGWWRKHDDDDTDEHQQRMQVVEEEREVAVARAETVRQVVEVHLEMERMVSAARAEDRQQRLEPVMAMYNTVQENKHARLRAAREHE